LSSWEKLAAELHQAGENGVARDAESDVAEAGQQRSQRPMIGTRRRQQRGGGSETSSKRGSLGFVDVEVRKRAVELVDEASGQIAMSCAVSSRC
jgi:hypothetical protein